MTTESPTSSEEIYCHECSGAGGAERPIYHLPPACGTPSESAGASYAIAVHSDGTMTDMAMPQPIPPNGENGQDPFVSLSETTLISEIERLPRIVPSDLGPDEQWRLNSEYVSLYQVKEALKSAGHGDKR